MRNSSIPPHISSAVSTAAAVAGCSPSSKHITAVELALREARRLHRASKDATLLVAMPAVRRAHTAGVLAGLTLSALYRQRQLLQRKHFLRTLAAEAGFASWDAYLPVLRSQPARALEQCATRLEFGYPNAWFSTYAQAIAFADEHGGMVVRHGHQAMVVRPECSELKAEAQHDT